MHFSGVTGAAFRAGLTAFGSSVTAFGNTNLTTSPTQAAIAPFWDDLHTGGTGTENTAVSLK